MSKPARKSRDVKVGGLPRYAYVALMSRIGQGLNLCDTKYADAYRPIAHMLDEYGVIRQGFKGQYQSRLHAGKVQIDSDGKSNLRECIYKRLVDHLKKNVTRRGAAVYRDLSRSRNVDRRCQERFGFSVSELIAAIEPLFTEGMTWERVVAGDIQLDHEIPVRLFDLSTHEGVKRAYALSNMRPLWRGDNARKGRTADLQWIELFGEGSIK